MSGNRGKRLATLWSKVTQSVCCLFNPYSVEKSSCGKRIYLNVKLFLWCETITCRSESKMWRSVTEIQVPTPTASFCTFHSFIEETQLRHLLFRSTSSQIISSVSVLNSIKAKSNFTSSVCSFVGSVYDVQWMVKKTITRDEWFRRI